MVSKGLAGTLLTLAITAAALGSGNQLSLSTGESASNWRFTNGPEFPGANGKLVRSNGIRIDGDFTQGGGYVGVYHPVSTEFGELTFTIQTDASQVAVRLVDADGQTHQHFLPLSGKANAPQTITVPATGSPEHHWGGANDGTLRGPVKEIGFVTHRGDFKQPNGSFTVTNVTLDKIPADAKFQAAYRPVAADRFFIAPNSREPLAIALTAAPVNFSDRQLAYRYDDYTGKTIATGKAAYDSAAGTLLLPPPQTVGYYDLVMPELGIWGGVTVDEPFTRAADEYFAIDSSFSWGGPPEQAEEIRSYLRILKNNGIAWNRDRIGWEAINPAPGQYNFDNRFDLYHRVAAEEGVKTLDTFHDTPRWNRRDAAVEYGSNRYPRNLAAAADSWRDIVRNWPTIKALEVWNEPDIFFGNNFPGEFVTAFTKAVSYRFAKDKLDCEVVGGVFAWPREESNHYRLYLENGMLHDVDVLSFHTYATTPRVEKPVSIMRESELAVAPERAGIPYWLTECGMPWKRGTHRATVPDDRNSAAEIIGKAVEYRALGVERYFAFEFKYYDENEKNFGMMDRNFFPMRSMAAYTHAARVLAHKEYLGDLRVPGAVRSRVFSDGQTAVAVLYTGVGEDHVANLSLPAALRARNVTGLDGRPLKTVNGKIPMDDGIAYVYFNENEVRPFVDTETNAMKYYRLAKQFNRAPRAAKALVLQPDYELDTMTYTCYGYDVTPGKPVEFQVKLNNLGDEAVEFKPELKLCDGIEAVEFDSKPITLAAGAARPFRFRIRTNADFPKNEYRHIQLRDAAGAATPLALSVRAVQKDTIDALPLTPETQQFTLAGLNAGKGWREIDPAAYQGWQGGEIDCNIQAKFRLLYTADLLQLQVLVHDPVFSCNYNADAAWNGDSVQFAIQFRESTEKLPADRKYHEFTAARSTDGEKVFRHVGTPRGIDDAVGMRLIELAPGNRCYVIDLPKNTIGAAGFVPGASLGFSMLVNDNNGRARNGYLPWGEGIAGDKDCAFFNQVEFIK